MPKRINLNIFQEFFRSKQIGGVLLILSVICALVIANSSIGPNFSALLNVRIGPSNDLFDLNYPVALWINDGLMAIFFLLVGLEIKREVIEGELSSPTRAAMPIIAAVGGMLFPAAIYILINHDQVTSSGWAIPMATDIAFALGIISLLGSRVPASLKIFLAALAIADDLGAIMVIAIFYTNELHWSGLGYSALILAYLVAINRLGVTKLVFYIIPGLFLWYFVHHSGIHATIAGVLLALTIPTNETSVISPLEKLEHTLAKPVNLLIMPIFAISNTNIVFEKEMIDGLYSPLGLGVILGLLVGKPVGIFLSSWIAYRFRIAKLPSGATWRHIWGVGLLGGIGFTMSIFIALLSFTDALHQTEAKFSILTASLLAGTIGFLLLRSAKTAPVTHPLIDDKNPPTLSSE